jgi:protein-disulfide isomerase/uncharacterized membrane protein
MKSNKIILLLSFLMICLCLYMTDHYYKIYFPAELNSGNSCNISYFWNCDKAVFSSASSLFSVPTSLLGLFVGLFVFLTTFFASQNFQRSNYIISVINSLGCLAFLIYSIFFLKGLCLSCCVYYLCSFLLALTYYRSLPFSFHRKSLFLFATTFVVYFVSLNLFFSKKHKLFAEASAEIIEEFLQSEDYSNIKIKSPLHLTLDNDDFYQSPLHVTIFSDFECPACKVLSQMIFRIKLRYKNKIKIQFIPFSMNDECNPLTQFTLHPFACHAARSGFCAKNFEKTHDFLFENQENFSLAWFTRHFASSCFKDNKTNEKLKELASYSKDYKIESTPTLIINGKKLEGILPVNLIFKLMDKVLEKRLKHE